MLKSLVLCASAAILVCVAEASVQEVFCERFDQCEGTNIGNGWINTDLIRGSYYNFHTQDLWRCDNPGDVEFVYPIAGKAAIFDSDSMSSTDNLPENVALTSPVFDTRGVDFASQAFVVDWDQYFVEGYDAKIFVEVWNGHAWIEVYSETETTFNPDHQTVDITEHVSGGAGRGMESRVRFRWTGDASWFWIVDNVRVLLVNLAVNPNGCPSNAPHKCAHDGACVAHDGECLLANNCPADKPVRCLDGTCVADGATATCSDLIDCPDAMPVRCASGACAATAVECSTASNCPATKPQRCGDGSCAANARECPLTLACPDEFNPYPCRGGSCVAAPELCPKQNAAELVCPCDQVLCPDQTCAASYADCSCPCTFPYRCTESAACVQESIFCKDTQLPTPAVVAERFGGYGAVRLVRVAECPAGMFRCFDGACVASLTACADVPCAAFESKGNATLAYKCPDGSCARSREECTPIASCGSRWLKRCGDGSCVHTDDECPAVAECSLGRTRCPDGRCYAGACPPFHGCSVTEPFQCPNGACACNQAQCYAGCGPKQHKCAENDECRPWSEDCPNPAPSAHRAVPFGGNLNCIAIREDSVYYDVVIVADRHFDDLFATVMIPAGILEKQPADAQIEAFDVPLSEVRPVPAYPATISHVLGVTLPATVFANSDFVRLTLRVELPVGAAVSDYCLAQLVEFDDGEHEWQCVDSALVQDGEHFSGLVQNVDGLFVIMKKPGVCHKYRGFDDAQLEFIMLGRVIPKTIRRLQLLHNRLSAIRERMPEIKRSDAVLTHIAKATYLFSEECLSDEWQAQLSTFPAQLGASAASEDNNSGSDDDMTPPTTNGNMPPPPPMPNGNGNTGSNVHGHGHA